MSASWVEIRKSGDYVKMGQTLGVDPVIARILNNRGIPFEEMEYFLYGDLDDLKSPHLMENLDALCIALKEKIDGGKKIRVIGDYDIDGVFAAYILYKALSRVGAVVDVVLPHRINDGYGMNPSMIEKASADGVDTIITCDNGISAFAECELAESLGMTVFITDHHEIPFHYEDDKKVIDLPSARVVVDPKLMSEDFYHNLCGAAVCYKLSQVLYELYGIDDCEEFLEYAAFATIGDIMPLIGENRIIVKHGLVRLKNTQNEGLRALIKACELEGDITPYHVGFVLGPCINASGRLDDAMDSFDLLCADAMTAPAKANFVRTQNEERKALTEEGLKVAMEMIDVDNLPHVIVLLLPNVHESLLGIIAGKLKESFYRPAIALTLTEDGVKGSGRSIDAYNLYEHLSECKDMFSKFGGHAAAAGLSIKCEAFDAEKKVEELSAFLNANDNLSDKDFEKKIEIDAVLPFSYITEALVDDLHILEPLGNGLKKPVFATRNVKFHSGRILGAAKRTFKGVAIDDSGRNIDALFFGEEEQVRELCDLCAQGRTFSVLYYPQINEYRGQRNLQIVVQDYR